MIEKTITYIGDIHYTHNTPSSRKDDYQKTVVNKLKAVKVHAPADAYILLGDVFHKHSMPVRHLAGVVPALRDLGVVYSVVGNHDCINHDIDKIGSTNLGLLFKTGLVQRLESIKLKVGEARYVINGLDFKGAIPESMPGCINVLVGHRFYENSTVPIDEYALSNIDLSHAGYDFVVLGHDHAPYEDHITKDGITIIRPGSLTRGTSHGYNMERFIRVCRMTLGESGATHEYIEIPSAPPEDVFNRRVFEPKLAGGKDMISLVRKILSAKSVHVSPFEVLKGIKIKDPDIRTYIETLLHSHGYVQ